MFNPMSDELISAMVDKRAELQKLIAALQADVYHIDGALVALGRQNLVPLRHTRSPMAS